MSPAAVSVACCCLLLLLHVCPGVSTAYGSCRLAWTGPAVACRAANHTRNQQQQHRLSGDGTGVAAGPSWPICRPSVCLCAGVRGVQLLAGPRPATPHSRTKSRQPTTARRAPRPLKGVKRDRKANVRSLSRVAGCGLATSREMWLRSVPGLLLVSVLSFPTRQIKTGASAAVNGAGGDAAGHSGTCSCRPASLPLSLPKAPQRHSLTAGARTACCTTRHATSLRARAHYCTCVRNMCVLQSATPSLIAAATAPTAPAEMAPCIAASRRVYLRRRLHALLPQQLQREA